MEQKYKVAGQNIIQRKIVKRITLIERGVLIHFNFIASENHWRCLYKSCN